MKTTPKVFRFDRWLQSRNAARNLLGLKPLETCGVQELLVLLQLAQHHLLAEFGEQVASPGLQERRRLAVHHVNGLATLLASKV